VGRHVCSRTVVVSRRTTGPDRERSVRHETENPRAPGGEHYGRVRVADRLGGGGGGHDGRSAERVGQVPAGLRQQRVRRPARGRADVRPAAAAVHTGRRAAPAVPVRRDHRPRHTHNGRRREAAQRVGRGRGRRRARPPDGRTLRAQTAEGHTVHLDQRESFS